MYYCSNYVLAVALCAVTMLCWGSWGNTQKLAGKTWRYEFFYWDYVLGLVIFSLVAGLTMGSSGGGAWRFVANLKSSFAAQWLWPLLGGVVFNASNILLSAAIAVAGMSVAFPVGVGLALVGGTVANRFVDGKGDPLLLWTGLAVIVASIVCNALAFKAKESCAGAASDASTVRKGLILSVCAGLLMSWFSPLVNRVVDMNFANPAPGNNLMTPYTAFFVFTLGVFASNFVFNTIMMRKPVSGVPLKGADWFKGGFGVHLVGILGGAIWATGTLLSFVTAGTAGAAIAYALGQGAMLVSAIWGIFVWKEFKGAPKRAGVLNAAMIVLFCVGLALIIAAGR
jgi:glucose uptake protein